MLFINEKVMPKGLSGDEGDETLNLSQGVRNLATQRPVWQ